MRYLQRKRIKVQSERKFMLKKLYPRYVLPLAMFSHIGHLVEILELITNLANRWCHLHQLQIGPPSGIALTLLLVQNLVIRWRHFHCFQSCPPGHVTCLIALLALSVSIEIPEFVKSLISTVRFHIWWGPLFGTES